MSDNSVEIVVPAYNEALRLEQGFLTLRNWLDGNGLSDVRICIAENGSRDATPRIAERLARQYAGTRVIRLPEPSLAEALKLAWASSSAAILAYCDADMATDPAHIAEALKILRENPDCVLVSGSRHLPGARVSGRNCRRRIVSRIYAICVNLALGTHFSDSACGFKFLRRSWFEELAGKLLAEQFTLGAELAMFAERRSNGALIEIPVRWEERAGTHVRLLPTIWASAKNILKMRRARRIVDAERRMA